MRDLRRWQSLSQLLEAMLDQSFRFEDSLRLVLHLVRQLELEYTSMKTGNSSTRQEEIFSIQEEVANQGVRT